MQSSCARGDEDAGAREDGALSDDIDRVLDDACGLFYAHDPGGTGRPTRLYVSPDVYRAIARVRQRELERGIPLIVLDLDLEADPSLHDAEVRVG